MASAQGNIIRLTGQGALGHGQGKSGDLYLEVEFSTHSIYRVDQHDVYLDFPVAPWEVALGAALNVPTPNGVVEIKIPAGASSGSKLRLKGRGIPSSTPGDFYAVLKIALPPADNEEAKEVYRNMSEKFKPLTRAANWDYEHGQQGVAISNRRIYLGGASRINFGRHLRCLLVQTEYIIELVEEGVLITNWARLCFMAIYRLAIHIR